MIHVRNRPTMNVIDLCRVHHPSPGEQLQVTRWDYVCNNQCLFLAQTFSYYASVSFSTPTPEHGNRPINCRLAYRAPIRKMRNNGFARYNFLAVSFSVNCCSHSMQHRAYLHDHIMTHSRQRYCLHRICVYAFIHVYIYLFFVLMT